MTQPCPQLVSFGLPPMGNARNLRGCFPLPITLADLFTAQR